MPQLFRAGVVIPQIAHMDNNGQLVLNHFVHREKPGIVNVKDLRVWVDLNAPQALFYNVCHFVFQVVHCCVDSAVAIESRLFFKLFQNEIVDMPGALGLDGHGKHHKF